MDQALMGLRRRLAQQQQQEADERNPNSVVARVRRRNEQLDHEIRRGHQGGQTPSGTPIPVPPSPMAGGGHRAPSSHARRSASGAPAGSPSGSRRSGSTVSRFLTQAAQQPEPARPSSEAGSGAGAGAGRPYVDQKKLREIQRQPKNTSPAMHLHLPSLLPPMAPDKKDKNVLILDIDETLVHASVTPNKPFDVRLTIEVENERGFIFVAFRPGLMEFLDWVAPLFEIVIFTASQSCYADQLMDHLDPKGKLGRLRLFREHCTEVHGARVKDLSLIGRPLERVAIIDNSPVAYLFQQRNSIPIISWFDDPHDREYQRLYPMLKDLAETRNVYDVLDNFKATVA